MCFVDDLIEGILRLAVSDEREPVNIGNPHEITMLELAETIQDVVGKSTRPLPRTTRASSSTPGLRTIPTSGTPTSPRRAGCSDGNPRRADISKARRVLGWEPEVSLRDGLARTTDSFRSALG